MSIENKEQLEDKDQVQENKAEKEDMNEAEENDLNAISDEESNPMLELEEKVTAINDKYLRLYSDFENYRKRTAKEKLDLITNGNASLLRKIIPVMDDFERAIESNREITDPEVLKEGFNLIYSKLKRTLEAEGVKEMESTGEPFDVEYHEAITNIPAPDKSLKGKVIDTTEKGYFLNDSVLRYAKVVVGA
jgi:molecular chaperone GrpE